MLRGKFKIKLLKKPGKIIENLHLGTSIPIREDLKKYIRQDIVLAEAKSTLLVHEGIKVGYFLYLIDTAKSLLYFGYFKVKNDDKKLITLLLEKLNTIAKENGCNIIRGPINIPTILYGWGFMDEGSSSTLSLGKPVNPPIYQKIFLNLDFYVKFEEITWEGRMVKINPLQIPKYDFSEYEYFNPKDRKELNQLKQVMLNLHAKNLPPSARITPDIEGSFDNYTDFVLDFGKLYMFFFVRHLPSDKIVACGTSFPNIFSTNKKGNFNNLIYYSWVVHPEHRRKGLALYMYGLTSIKAKKDGYKIISGPIAKDNKANTALAQKYGIENTRRHLILEKIRN